jgi:uncharacterized delta-60 repeat protein
MPELTPLFLSTGSIRVITGSRVVDYMHFPVTTSFISGTYSTNLPDPYLFATMSANITNAVSATSSSLFQFLVPSRYENYFYAHNSIVGVQTSATTTGVRIGIQRDNRADGIANIKVSSTLTAHTIACVGSFSATTFALPASMAAINTIYPCFVKGFYNNSTSSVNVNNVILLQPETNNTVTANSGSVSYNKLIGYQIDLLDRTFNIGSGFDGAVNAIEIQPDQKIVCVGSFTTYNGTTQNNITRLNPNGTRDTSFSIGTGFDATAFNAAVQNDGKIVAIGQFATYNGTTQNGITRLNPDGTRDTSFSIGTGFDSVPYGLAIQDDGKIIVGGQFTTYNGTTQNRITRLNSDGTRDTTFNIGAGISSNSVNEIKIQDDGKIIVVGSFIDYSGSTQNNIVRLNLDGTIDTSFNIGTGFSGTVGSTVFGAAIQSDQKIVCVGDFTSYSGSTQNRITRLNPDGTRDTTFNIGTGLNTQALKVAIQNDGKIIVAGGYQSYNGVTQKCLIRLNSDGTRDSTFGLTQTPFPFNIVPEGFDAQVLCVNVQTDGKILAGGFFGSYYQYNRNYIIRLLNSIEVNQKTIPLYLSTGSLRHITGSDTVSSSFLPVTASLWLSQSLTASVANTSATAYATVFNLSGLTTGKRYLANLYLIGLSAAAATGFRMRVATGSAYRGTLYTPTSTTAPAIQNSADGANIISITAGNWPTVNVKYLVYGDYTFIKGTTDPQVQIISETAGTAVTAVSGSVIYYRALD